jgi:hypothetical protein
LRKELEQTGVTLPVCIRRKKAEMPSGAFGQRGTEPGFFSFEKFA